MNKYIAPGILFITSFSIVAIGVFLVQSNKFSLNAFAGLLKGEQQNVSLPLSFTYTQEPDPAILSKIDYWKQIVEKYPDYRDGYVQVAYLFYQTGKREEARLYLDKALILDPNYLPVLELQENIK